MSRDPRLDAWCEVLRIALRTYLDALARHWVHDDANPTGQRAAASIGTRGEPEPVERAAVRELLATDTAGPLTRIAQALALTPGEEALAAAAWWAQTDPQFAFALGCAHDDGARRHASAALVRVLLEPFGIEVPPLATDRGRLVRGGVLEPGAGATDPLVLTATAAELLAGIAPEALGEEGTRKVARGGAQAAGRSGARDAAREDTRTVARGDSRAAARGDAQDAARDDTQASLDADGGPPARLAAAHDGLVRHLRAPDPGVVMLRGPAGIGRRALAVSAARAAGLVPVADTRPARELALLARLGVALPIVDAEALEALDWGHADGPLVAIANADAASGGAHVVDLPGPDFAERERTWSAALERADLDADPHLLGSLSARFAFTERDVEDVIRRATRDARWSDRPLDGAMIWEAARRQPEHALSKLAALVAPGFTLDDLVVDADCRAKLGELVSHVELQHVVLDEWGFRRRLPRGQGVIALFAGPSGTGKTMAAEAVAATLRHDLYRVDLSAVVSKYIGETEKNLAAAFDEAQRAGAVLFFDEADALFGKRTEVKDAHDRYANLEINYLLQRVETFTGLVILATNRQSALDEAFLRRLRFVIRFELPEAAFRAELWRRSFPPGKTSELDWEELAIPELSGGSIQGAALAAAYLAAAGERDVSAADVQHAMRREFEKLGRAWPGRRNGVPA